MVISCPFCKKSAMWLHEDVICPCGKAIFISSKGIWFHADGNKLKKKSSYNKDIIEDKL